MILFKNPVKWLITGPELFSSCPKKTEVPDWNRPLHILIRENVNASLQQTT